MILGFVDRERPASGFEVTCLDGSGTFFAAIGAQLGLIGLAGLLAGDLAVNLASNDVSDVKNVSFYVAEMSEWVDFKIFRYFAIQMSDKLLKYRGLDVEFRG